MNDPECDAFIEELCKDVLFSNRKFYRDIFRKHSNAKVCRVLGEAKEKCKVHLAGGAYNLPNSQTEIQSIIDRYSPKPKYCEGMTEAINKRIVEVFYEGDDTPGQNNKRYRLKGMQRDFDSCIFCPDGEDCLKEAQSETKQR